MTRSFSSATSTRKPAAEPLRRQNSSFPAAAPRPAQRNLNAASTSRIEHDFSPVYTAKGVEALALDRSTNDVEEDEDCRYITSDEIIARVESLQFYSNQHVPARLKNTTEEAPVKISPRIPRRKIQSLPIPDSTEDVYENAQNFKGNSVVKVRPMAAPRNRPLEVKPRMNVLKPVQPPSEDDPENFQDDYENALGEFCIGVSSSASRKGRKPSPSNGSTSPNSKEPIRVQPLPTKDITVANQTRPGGAIVTISSEQANTKKPTTPNYTEIIKKKKDNSISSNPRTKRLIVDLPDPPTASGNAPDLARALGNTPDPARGSSVDAADSLTVRSDVDKCASPAASDR